MNKYKVYVQETSIFIYYVEANSPEEAENRDGDEDCKHLSCEEKILAIEEDI